MQYKILIVDDEPMLTELLADYLGDMDICLLWLPIVYKPWKN